MKVRNLAKKLSLTLLLAALAVVACAGFAACGVKAESITLSETSVSLDSKGSQTLTYTVLPEEAKVKIEISDKTVVKYENDTLTALTAGQATVKVYSTADKNVYAECSVTVAAPDGYKTYDGNGCKFVYPSAWTKKSAAGTVVNYADSNNSGVNLVTESKNNIYFRMNADGFKNSIIQTYSNMGYTATFTKCTAEKSNYLGYTRVHVVYDYTLSLGSISSSLHQEQMILNSGKTTCVLTVSFAAENYNQSQTETIFSEFVGTK